MKEGSDAERVEAGETREGKWRRGERRRGEAWGGSVGYPFESWKLIQRADKLRDGQTAKQPSVCLCIVPSFRPHYTVKTFTSLWKHSPHFLMVQSWKTCIMSQVNRHTLCIHLSVMLIWCTISFPLFLLVFVFEIWFKHMILHFVFPIMACYMN